MMVEKTEKCIESQDVYWNQFLSWFFVQQKEYGKAFIQEKAVYKRNPESFYNIVTLGSMAMEEKQFDDAKLILKFVHQKVKLLHLQTLLLLKQPIQVIFLIGEIIVQITQQLVLILS
jgi:hypothetical protein